MITWPLRIKPAGLDQQEITWFSMVKRFKKKSMKTCFKVDESYGLRMIFANSLDPDQDRQNVGPDLDLNRLTL